MLLRAPHLSLDRIGCARRGPCLARRQSIASGRVGYPQRPARIAAPRVVFCSANGQQDPATAIAPVRDEEFEVTLKGLEALQTVRLGLAPEGKGQAIVVTEVAEGSRAEELGVRRGMKLNALSDPMRYGDMWSLLDRPSLRFVVDTFKMRRSSPIDLLFQPMLGTADMDAIFGAVNTSAVAEAGAEEAGGASSSAAPQQAASGYVTSSRSASESALSNSVSSIDSMLGSSSDSDSEGSGLTIGERLAAKYADQQKQAVAVNEVQKRIDRRKAYMDIDDQRDDTALLLGLAAAFTLPALVILVFAYFNGYLDRLYLTALTLR